MLKSKKGISLTTMVITVLVMLIVMGTLVYSAVDSVKIRKLNKFYSDLRELNDTIELYYLRNGELPTKGSPIVVNLNADLTDKNMSFVTNGKETNVTEADFFNPNDIETDTATYYEIDLDLLDNISLNYPTNKYIINTKSHTVYNYTGITVEKKVYNYIPLNYTKV